MKKQCRDCSKILISVIGVLLVLFLSGCQKQNWWGDEPLYETGVYYDKDWDKEMVGTYKGNAIPDKETAIAVASAIQIGIQGEERAVLQVFYDVEDEIWIVTFVRPSSVMMNGGCISIALRQEDGQVLRIWGGE
jgi:hypothetical protein